MLLPLTGPGVLTSDDGRRFVAFRVDDGPRGWRVTDAACPHNKGPLDQGWVRDGHTVVCPWHWYRFDLDTGECETSPQHVLGVYPVVDVDGVPHADVGAPPAPQSWAERLRAHARGQS
ncbi:Rieske (2Fe-2S) protein [Pseudonocardia endophytica]|uniref:Nitrite reductase/ring-hydroxylating ferredoxin subunit n=1 Tax=Pseudonocardia endophytica TaxID=401976 RepID=A0A4R1HKR4_PSEEN|nr:Rieske 2Fe-2S domain-containing protein [Pseudonocardia endophytica]TCK21651.1 nitrite reductase/ring-hydroxylating ferredoxin subunit [Pseudonocardia endophytica]